MSVNCWVLLQLDLPRARAEQLLATHPAEWEKAKDFYFALWEELRYGQFDELEADEKATTLESFLGEPILRHLKDPRGVAVMAEGGQSYQVSRYRDAVDDSIFVKVRSSGEPEPGPRAENDDGEAAVLAILEWSQVAKKRDPEAAGELMEAVLSGRWAEAAHQVARVPELKRYAAVFAARARGKASPEGKRPLEAALELKRLLPGDAEWMESRHTVGSRAFQREYRALFVDQIFGELVRFSRFIDRASFGSPEFEFFFGQAMTGVPAAEAIDHACRVLDTRDCQVETGSSRSKEKHWLGAVAKDGHAVFMTHYFGEHMTKGGVSILVRQRQRGAQKHKREPKR